MTDFFGNIEHHWFNNVFSFSIYALYPFMETTSPATTPVIASQISEPAAEPPNVHSLTVAVVKEEDDEDEHEEFLVQNGRQQPEDAPIAYIIVN